MAHSDDKKKVRLNLISHLLGRIPYQEAPRKKVTLPKRQKEGAYRSPAYQYEFIPDVY